jgi:hypothetical protein
MLLKKYFGFLLLACTCCISCRHEKTSPEKRVVPTITIAPAKKPYATFLAETKTRSSFLCKQKSITELKQHLFNSLAKEMPLYWVGTKWDFNGTTRTPGNGNIACGYFVTTVLEDMGFKLNRVKLSQQPSSVMINALCRPVKRFASFVDVKKYASSFSGNSVFIVGLDFHTGFLIKEEDRLYFFHSNYINRQGVVMQLAEESGAIIASKSFMIGSLPANEKLLKSLLSE